MNEHALSRRGFLTGFGVASLSGTIGVGETRAQAKGGGVYENLGVQPLINAAGTYTSLGGSLILPEVRAAMDEAARHYVSIAELHEAAGNRIASLVGAEAAPDRSLPDSVTTVPNWTALDQALTRTD